MFLVVLATSVALFSFSLVRSETSLVAKSAQLNARGMLLTTPDVKALRWQLFPCVCPNGTASHKCVYTFGDNGTKCSPADWGNNICLCDGIILPEF